MLTVSRRRAKCPRGKRLPGDDDVGYVRAGPLLPEGVTGPGWNRSLHGEAREKGSFFMRVKLRFFVSKKRKVLSEFRPSRFPRVGASDPGAAVTRRAT